MTAAHTKSTHAAAVVWRPVAPTVVCSGKFRFASPTLAAKVAKRSPHPLQSYRCRFCGGWHLGNRRIGPSNKMRAVLVRVEPAP